MRMRFALTHIDRDGARRLTFANLAHKLYDTREAADESRAKFIEVGDLRKNKLGGMIETLEVREVECYDHGEAVGIYFDEGPTIEEYTAHATHKMKSTQCVVCMAEMRADDKG